MFGRKHKDSAKAQTAAPGNNQTINAQNGDGITISVVSKPSEDKGSRTKGRVTKIAAASLALASIGFTLYAVVRFFQARSSENSAENAYLTLLNSSYAKSKSVYASFGTADVNHSNRKIIKDYAFMGNHLFLSTHKITPKSLEDTSSFVPSGYDGYAMYNLTTDVSWSSQLTTDFANGVYSLDLSKAGEGDYLIYPYSGSQSNHNKENDYPVSIDTEAGIRQEFYTLPDKNNQRRRIVFKNNTASPYTLITVTACGDSLPSSYYDAVVYPRQYDDNLSLISQPGLLSRIEESISAINTDSGYRLAYAEDIVKANSIHAGIAFGIDNTLGTDYTSIFLPKSGYMTKALGSESFLAGYDYYPEIRELSGYLNNAGHSYSGVVGNDILPLSDSVIGKESYLINGGDDMVITLRNLLAVH